MGCGSSSTLYAGNNLDKARRIFRAHQQVPAAHPADDPPAHAGVGRVAMAQTLA